MSTIKVKPEALKTIIEKTIMENGYQKAVECEKCFYVELSKGLYVCGNQNSPCYQKIVSPDFFCKDGETVKDVGFEPEHQIYLNGVK